MSDRMPEPVSTRRRFRPFWTLVAVGIVLVMEGARYFGVGVAPEDKPQRPAPVPSQPERTNAETDQDSSLPQNENKVD